MCDVITLHTQFSSQAIHAHTHGGLCMAHTHTCKQNRTSASWIVGRREKLQECWYCVLHWLAFHFVLYAATVSVLLWLTCIAKVHCYTVLLWLTCNAKVHCYSQCVKWRMCIAKKPVFLLSRSVPASGFCVLCAAGLMQGMARSSQQISTVYYVTMLMGMSFPSLKCSTVMIMMVLIMRFTVSPKRLEPV